MANQPDVVMAQSILDYHFQDIDWLREALQVPGSNVAIRGTVMPDGNKRLALLGDGVLRMMILGAWYTSDENRQGSAQRLEAFNSGRLAEIARQSNIEICIAINPSQRGQITSPALLTDTLAASLGAVWKDSGYDVAVTNRVASYLG
ncbi:hypothetical protein LTR66_002490 [Elasticomyces elasticus]|nr:hypothetical protein LTR66_002490 [Elasticomyces elasticus]